MKRHERQPSERVTVAWMRTKSDGKAECVCGRAGPLGSITGLTFDSEAGIPEFIGKKTQLKMILQANLMWGESFFTAT